MNPIRQTAHPRPQNTCAGCRNRLSGCNTTAAQGSLCERQSVEVCFDSVESRCNLMHSCTSECSRLRPAWKSASQKRCPSRPLLSTRSEPQGTARHRNRPRAWLRPRARKHFSIEQTSSRAYTAARSTTRVCSETWTSPTRRCGRLTLFGLVQQRDSHSHAIAVVHCIRIKLVKQQSTSLGLHELGFVPLRHVVTH